MKIFKRIMAVALVLIVSIAGTTSVFASERGFGRGQHGQGHRQAVCQLLKQDGYTIERRQGFGCGRGTGLGQGTRQGLGIGSGGVRQSLNNGANGCEQCPLIKLQWKQPPQNQ